MTPRRRQLLDGEDRRGAGHLLVAAEGEPDVLGRGEARSSSASTAAQIATSSPLSSRVPRPQIAPSWISAPNGGCCQGASSSTGTTSRWAISTTGRSALWPGPVEEQAVGVDPGQLEPLVQQRELALQLGHELVEGGDVDEVRVAVRDRGDADQGLELGDGGIDHASRVAATALRRRRSARCETLGRCGSLTGRRYADGLAWCPQRPRCTTSATGLRGAPRRGARRALADVVVADRHDADRVEVVGDAERLAHRRVLVRRDADEARAEAGVGRRLQDQQARPSRCPCPRRASASAPRPGRSSPCRPRRTGSGTRPCWSTAGSRPAPSSSRSATASGWSMSSAVGDPEAAYVVGGVEHQERPALAEAGVGRAGRVVQRQVDDGRVDRARSSSCGPSCDGGRRPGTPCGQVWGEQCLTTSSGCGPTSRRWGGRPRPAATSGSRSRRRSASCAAWFVEQCAARGLRVESDDFGNVVGWWDAGAGPARPDRLAPGLRARRRRVRRPARRRLRAGRDRPDALARRRADAAGRGVGVRRGGGLAVRPRLPRLAAGGRRDLVGVGAGADRP